MKSNLVSSRHAFLSNKSLSVLIALLAALLFFPVLTAYAGPTWTPKYGGTTVNGQTVPLGYYEYLPTSYNSGSPLSNYSIVIFLHGSGEYGNGLATGSPNLSAVLGAGVPNYIQNNTSPLAQSGGEFDTNNVIVLCPQHDDADPWVPATQVRPFLNFALAAYPKIDKRRIWLTGLSYGSSGVTKMMEKTYDPSPDDAAAVVACAWRGDIFASPDNAIGKLVPFWGLTSQGDTWYQESGTLSIAANNLAAAISGNNSLTDVAVLWANLSNPGTTVYTGNFDGTSTWNWATGVDATTGVNPKVTVFTGSDHDSWDRTYSNTNTWTWLFQQQKPDVSLTSPSDNTISGSGSNVSFAGTATDKNGTSLTGSSLQWIDSQDGVLGTGTTLSTSSLSYGYHVVKLQATDNSFRDNKTLVHVTVPYTGAFTANFDFGPTGVGTTGWNDFTNNNATVFPSPSFITNAVNSAGTHVGINLCLNPGFYRVYTNGVASSALYPLAAQEGNFNQQTVDDGGNPLPNPQLVVSGLNPSESYTFTFFCSTTAYEAGPTQYTIGSTTVSLSPINNTSNTVSITASPNAAGQVTINTSRGTNAAFIWLNVMTISTSGGGVNSAPSISGTAPAGTVSTAYHFTYTVSGTPSPTCSVTAGSLPAGLSLATNGVISGTPTTAATYTGTITATNGVSPNATDNFSIVVSSVPTISGTAPGGTTGTAYHFTYTTAGSPSPTCSVTAGSLPAGLSLATNGVISGTPTTAATYTGTVTANNGVGTAPTTNFSIVISAAPVAPSISGTAPGGTVSTAYSFTYTVSGNPSPTCSVTAGSLPAGLSLNTTTGVISGTPTTAATYTGTITATNGVSPNATDNFSIVVGGGGGGSSAVAINCGYSSTYTATDGTVYMADTYFTSGTSYTATTTITTGTDPTLYTYYRYGSPTPAVYNIPIANGTYTVHLKYAEMNTGNGVGSRVFGVTVQGTTVETAFDILTHVAVLTPLDESYSATVTNGTLTVGQVYIFGNPEFSAIKIVSPAPTITDGPPPSTGTSGTAYHFTYTASGSPAPTFNVSAGSLPTGLSLASSTGVISGTPTASGTYTGTVSATNTSGSATQNFSVVISPALVAAINCGYSSTYTATDGTVYSADTYFTSGTSFTATTTITTGTDPTLYTYYRYGSPTPPTYNIPMSNGTYVVHLKYAEMNTANGVGSRVFGVTVQGVTVESAFDIRAHVAVLTPLDEAYTASVTNGTLTLGQIYIGPGYDMISAIKVTTP